MPARYLALLRAIAHVPMQPFRQGLEELGFSDVESYGMSGNLMFNAGSSDKEALERRIAARLGAVTFVRSRSDLARVVAHDPFHGRDATVLFLARPPTAARRRTLLQLDFEASRPLLRGKTLYYVYPSRLRATRTPFDFERALGVEATARSAGIVRKLLDRMSNHP